MSVGFDTRLRIFLYPSSVTGVVRTLRGPVSMRSIVWLDSITRFAKKKVTFHMIRCFHRHQPVFTYSLIWPCFTFGKGFPIFRSAALSSQGRRERRGRAIFPWKEIGNKAPITERFLNLTLKNSSRCPVYLQIHCLVLRGEYHKDDALEL
jgi:hypothetical protein